MATKGVLSEGNIVTVDGLDDIDDVGIDKRPSEALETLLTSHAKEIVESIPAEYNMNHRYRGKALIFNHESFEPDLDCEDRKGTNKDKMALIELFKKLEFQVDDYDDLTKSEIRDKLQDVANENHSENDCFVCCLMTHGDNGIFYARDNKYAMGELWTPFFDQNCPTLAGKPRLFLIQACQGLSVDDGVEVFTRQIQCDSAADRIMGIEAHVDFLIAFSTVPGYYSWRNEINGSWFMQSLCKILGGNVTEDLLTILTKVNSEVAFNCKTYVPSNKKMHGKKQIPRIITMLTRKVNFVPKSSPKCN